MERITFDIYYGGVYISRYDAGCCVRSADNESMIIAMRLLAMDFAMRCIKEKYGIDANSADVVVVWRDHEEPPINKKKFSGYETGEIVEFTFELYVDRHDKLERILTISIPEISYAKAQEKAELKTLGHIKSDCIKIGCIFTDRSEYKIIHTDYVEFINDGMSYRLFCVNRENGKCEIYGPEKCQTLSNEASKKETLTARYRLYMDNMMTLTPETSFDIPATRIEDLNKNAVSKAKLYIGQKCAERHAKESRYNCPNEIRKTAEYDGYIEFTADDGKYRLVKPDKMLEFMVDDGKYRLVKLDKMHRKTISESKKEFVYTLYLDCMNEMKPARSKIYIRTESGLAAQEEAEIEAVKFVGKCKIVRHTGYVEFVSDKGTYRLIRDDTK